MKLTKEDRSFIALTNQTEITPKGYSRTWMKCKKCGTLQYQDYLPFSFSRPIRIPRCKHEMTDLITINDLI